MTSLRPKASTFGGRDDGASTSIAGAAISNRRVFGARLLSGAVGLALSGPAFGRRHDTRKLEIALVGDIIFQRPALAVTGPQMDLIVHTLRAADVAFGNFESSGFALDRFSGRHRDSGGPVVLSPPAAIAELRSMGLDLLSTANNHGSDWGEEGVLATFAALRDAGFTTAGSGASLTQARTFALQDFGGTKVALVSATTSIAPEGRARDAHSADERAHAGINALRLVSDAVLQGGDDEFGIDAMGGEDVRVASDDVQALQSEIAAAKRAAGLVIFSLHAHQGPPAGADRPSRHQIDLAHSAIDAGADIVAMHGPHQLRGIERYKGGAIFYSLGNFMVMLPEPSLNPRPMVISPGSIFTQRAFFESVVATVVCEHGKIDRVELQPIELRQTGQLDTHGVPERAFGKAADDILTRLRGLSRMLGTSLERSGSVGVVRFG